jgi:hypothetical protein
MTRGRRASLADRTTGHTQQRAKPDSVHDSTFQRCVRGLSSWTLDSRPRRGGASYRAPQNVEPSRGGPLVDRQRRQQQHRRSFGRHEQPVATARRHLSWMASA